jgi:hypothetical protein
MAATRAPSVVTPREVVTAVAQLLDEVVGERDLELLDVSVDLVGIPPDGGDQRGRCAAAHWTKPGIWPTMICVSQKTNVILITTDGERHDRASTKPPAGFSTLVAPKETIEALADLAETVSPATLAEFLPTLLALRQHERAHQRLEGLVTTMMPDQVMSRPVAEQVQRNAELRTRMLQEVEMLDSDGVATAVGSHARNRAAAASRLVRSGQVLFIDHGGRRLFPAFQFDLQAGQVRPECARVIEILAERHVRGWAALAWLTRANGWLSGARPVDRLTEAPEKVEAAARDIGVSGG